LRKTFGISHFTVTPGDVDGFAAVVRRLR
jgi:hypothetical protein